MTDGNLLVFGCAVTFVALAGAYVYLRERYEARQERRAPVARREEQRRPLRPAA